MSNDRPKFTPDLAKVLQVRDSAAFEQQERKALAKLVEAGLIDRLTPEPDRASAPSPWAKARATGIDKSALPSATAPAPGAPAEERPVTKRADAAAKRQWPGTWRLVGAAALLAVAAPLLSALLLAEMKGRTGKAGASAAETVPEAAAPLRGAAPPGAKSAGAPGTAAPGATAAPSTDASAAPSTAATPGATAKPSVPIKVPSRSPGTPHSGAPTNVPKAPPSPTVTTEIPPPPPPPDPRFEGKPVF